MHRRYDKVWYVPFDDVQPSSLIHHTNWIHPSQQKSFEQHSPFELGHVDYEVDQNHLYTLLIDMYMIIVNLVRFAFMK
jgi:hypothetical protein